MDPKAVIERMLGWVRHHPEDVVQALKNAVSMRLTIPLDALRFLASEAKGKRVPQDVEITAVPPGVRVAATLRAMKTTLRASGTLFVDLVRIGPEELRFEIRLQEVALAVIGESDSPIATLIRSGALNLSQPGKLVASLPNRPAFVVEGGGDRVVLDLMREPKIAGRLRRVTSLVTPLVTISGIESSGDVLGVQLSCLPDGLTNAVASLRAALNS
jgi:hypothetical protein